MTNTVATMSAVLKQVFADGLNEIINDHNYLLKNISFDKSKHPGASYESAVPLSREWGFTFNSDGSAFALAAARNATYSRASLGLTSLVMRGQISYAALERTVGDRAAFAEATAVHVKNLTESMSNIVEHELLYGQKSIAEFSATPASGQITITAASWAEGFWVNAIGMPFDVFVLESSAAATNTVGALVVSGVDAVNRIITFTGDAADLAAVDALTTGFVYFRSVKTGASSFNDSQGIDAFVTASTIFGISTATNSLWKPRTYSAGSADLTLAKIQRGLASSVNAGLMEDVCLLANPATWANLSQELSGLRSLDYSYDPAKNKNGQRVVEYYSQNGKIEVVAHPYVKQGEAFAFPKKKALRIGSRDIGFGAPGAGKDEPLFHLESTAAVEFRMFTDQALFFSKPSLITKFTNIVNT